MSDKNLIKMDVVELKGYAHLMTKLMEIVYEDYRSEEYREVEEEDENGNMVQKEVLMDDLDIVVDEGITSWNHAKQLANGLYNTAYGTDILSRFGDIKIDEK